MAQAYLTNAEFFALAIPSDGLSGLTSDEVTAGILASSGTADSYFRKRYKLPLVSWGNDVRQQVAKLAQFEMLSRQGFRPGSGNNEVARLRYEDAVRWLEKVATGLVEIDCVDSTPEVDEDGSLAADSGGATVSWNMTTGRRCRCSGPCCCYGRGL